MPDFGWIRQDVSNAYTRRLTSASALRIDSSRTAMVFAPHPDDETLGCGGTIIKKRNAHAQVTVVVMTDGRNSHSHLIAENELRAIRAEEARVGCGRLGIAADDLIQLGYRDGDLNLSRESALGDVCELIRARRPDEIFIPYRGETPLDHHTTFSIVIEAIARIRADVVVYEYPLWFLNQWPFVDFTFAGRREIPRMVYRTLCDNFRLHRDFKVASDISDVVAQKRNALDSYRSQMQRLLPDPRWLTLGDVGQGDFLKCFLRPFELFAVGRLL